MSAPGTVLAGRYRLESVIATGGMGVVWKGWDERLERAVAVKQLRPAPNLPDAEVEIAKDRAMREARITGRLQHPHAVQVFDAVEHDGQPCLIMPFLASTTLSVVLRESGPLPLARVARIGAEVASALAAAHRLGIVHRDVKPGNILITADGASHISDFGISHAMGDATLTSTGLIHGTPAYLAPEVALGETAHFPSDVFSLGSTLYAALEGAPPFGTDPNSIALLHKVAAARVPPPAHAGGLTSLLLEMLSSDPRSRPSMDEVASVLADYTTYAQLDEEPTVPRAAVAGASPSSHAQGGDTTELQETDPMGAQRVDEEPSSALSAWFSTRDATAPTAAGRVAGEQAERSPAGTAMQSPTEAPARPPGADPPGYAAGSGASALPPSSGRRRPSRAVLLAGAALLVLVIAVGALLNGLGPDALEGQGGAAPSTPASTPPAEGDEAETPRVQPTPSAETATPSAAETEPESSGEAEADPESTRAPETAAEPEPSPEPEPSQPAEPQPSPSPEPDAQAAPADRAAQLASAITDYYALMPDNTDEGWGLMTADYQTNHAGGFSSYDGFWDDVADVVVSDVQTTPPEGVVATLTYSFVDGSVAVERTAYRMVDEGGQLKIAASEVLSSRSG